MTTYSLAALPGRYAVCLFPPTMPMPHWAAGSDFTSITRTHDELSIICDQRALPDDLAEAISVARDWVLLRVEGPFSFEVTGVLATLSAVLAEAGIVILAIATYQTDYLLVKAYQVESAVAALRGAGHRVEMHSG
jgi:hypothetical protein